MMLMFNPSFIPVESPDESLPSKPSLDMGKIDIGKLDPGKIDMVPGRIDIDKLPNVPVVKASDLAERVLLGKTPDDLVMLPEVSLFDQPSRIRTKLEIVQSYLEAQPELQTELAKKTEEAWLRAGGKREQFMTETAEIRAQVISKAELSSLQQQAPGAISHFQQALSRYLVEYEKFEEVNSSAHRW